MPPSGRPGPPRECAGACPRPGGQPRPRLRRRHPGTTRTRRVSWAAPSACSTTCRQCRWGC
eukprot:1589839-Alexandrium_andersonii.AAC.1